MDACWRSHPDLLGAMWASPGQASRTAYSPICRGVPRAFPVPSARPECLRQCAWQAAAFPAGPPHRYGHRSCLALPTHFAVVESWKLVVSLPLQGSRQTRVLAALAVAAPPRPESWIPTQACHVHVNIHLGQGPPATTLRTRCGEAPPPSRVLRVRPSPASPRPRLWKPILWRGRWGNQNHSL